MSEERKMILQMVAEGKISAEEAEMLLQAIEEGERTAQSAAAQGVRENARRSTGFLDDLGETISRAVNESLKGLDREIRHMEVHLDRKLRENEHLRPKIEEKLRRAAERAAERVAQAEERAAHAAERAAERATRHAERMAERMEEHRRHQERHVSTTRFVKSGIVIDKEAIEQTQTVTLPFEAGDRLCLDNRVGDLTVEYYDGNEIIVQVKKTVWGEDKADAEARATATVVRLDRRGNAVDVVVDRPTIAAVGMVMLKDTRLDYTVRLPQGTQVELANKVGDIKVFGAQQVSSWHLATKVGDVDVQVAPDAGFRYDLRSATGQVVLSLPERVAVSFAGDGQKGDGSGQITVTVKTGDIRLHY